MGIIRKLYGDWNVFRKQLELMVQIQWRLIKKLSSFIFCLTIGISFSMPHLAGARATQEFEKCTTIFPEKTLTAAAAISQIEKPNIEKFVGSGFFKNLIQVGSKNLNLDKPRLLVAKFKNNLRPTAAVFYTLFVLIFPSQTLAQQSLFNAPSIESTEKHKFFFQEQVNVLPRETVSNTTLDYGLGQGWSVGMSLYNLKPYTLDTNDVDPEVLGNIEKTIQVTPDWKLGIGTQTGLNAGKSNDGSTQMGSFSYLQNMFLLPRSLGKFYLGYYQAK